MRYFIRIKQKYNSDSKYIKTFVLLSCFTFFLLISNSYASDDIDDIARDYVKLVLEVGQYDSEYVDAYFGPPEWELPEDEFEDDFPAQRLKDQVNNLIEKLENTATLDAFSPGEFPRYNFLKKQLESVKCKISILDYEELKFDEESQRLYDIVAPSFDKEYYENIHKEIEELLPGEGTLNERINQYSEKFIVPSDKVEEILIAAIKEYRNQTKKYITLPANEKLDIASVANKPWAANLQFNGNCSSTLQINTGTPFYMWDLIVLARHESYPGHHVYLATLEKCLYKDKKQIEFSILPLNSPLAFIAEGLAQYGCYNLLATDPEKMSFERDVLFPMAGFDEIEAAKYFKIMNLKDELEGAEIEAARKYLDEDMSYSQAHDFIEKYCLETFASAGAALSFAQQYQSYIISYSLGQVLLRNYIEKNISKNNDMENKWKIFKQLISTPITPSDLIDAKK